MSDLPVSGSYRLAVQVDERGWYASITLTRVARTKQRPLITFADQVDDAQLSDEEQVAIAFGASQALAWARQSLRVGFRITQLDTQPVDTTDMALAFATCRAVLNLFDIPESVGPYFDRASSSFVFPSPSMAQTH